MSYNSQFGQDEFLNTKVFQEAKNLTFIEIGSADPIKINNTYFFENQMGWTGLLIEARKAACKTLKRARTSTVVHACLANEDGRSIFLDYDYIAGLAKFMSEQEHQYIEEYFSKDSKVRAYWVQTKTLHGILEEHSINRCNLLAIDTEGGELPILKTIDYDKVQIDVIMAECNTESISHAVTQFLGEQGYHFVTSLGPDHIYIHRNSAYGQDLIRSV